VNGGRDLADNEAASDGPTDETSHNSGTENRESMNDGEDEKETSADEPDNDGSDSGTSHHSSTEDRESMRSRGNVNETPDEELGDPDDGVAAFAATHLVEAKDTITSLNSIYEQYEEYAVNHRYETRNRSQFTRSLKKAVPYDFESNRRRVDGDVSRVYIGIDFVSKQS
jgi:hypothetical protein